MLLLVMRDVLVLIESDWNLKFVCKVVFPFAGTGINRIRLEFKGR